MEFIDVFWLVQPAYSHHLAEYYKVLGDWESWHWYSNYIDLQVSDVGFVLFFVGIAAFVFSRALNKHPLVPMRDPRLLEAIQHENF